MRYFDSYCQGESHKSNNKECQDYSLSWQDGESGNTIAIVCDGHGGDSYFRSRKGAEIAANITLEQTRKFIKDVDPSLFRCSFTAVGTRDTIETESKLDETMRRLFASIYARWRDEITEDGKRELTAWEEKYVDEKNKSLLTDEQRIVKAYGCTLMAYVCTKDYWFAFHLGDGKMVMLDSEFHFSQPVPWDDKCFLYKTTSLCGSEPVKDFRFCVQGDGKFPIAMFLGSDGLDDTYGDGDKLYSFYGNIVKELATKGQESVEKTLKEDLPEISKRGSKDDMSVAVVYDEGKINEAAVEVNKFQIELVNKAINDLHEKDRKNKDLIQKVQELEASIPTLSSLETWEFIINRLREILTAFEKQYDTDKRKYDSENAKVKKKKAEVSMAEKELERDRKQMEALNERLKNLESFTLPEIKHQDNEEEEP